jgi:hypothetical protein
MENTKAASKSIKTKPKKMTAKEQSERFIKTARDLEADESGKLFDRAVRVIVKPRGG